MRKLARWLAVAATLVVASLAIASAAAAPNPRLEVRISTSLAVTTVEQMTGSRDLKVTGPFTAVDHRFYTLDGKQVHANVDAFTGQVRTLVLLDKVPTGASVRISMAQAKAAAARFLRDQRIGTHGLTAGGRLIDHGSMQEFLITYGRRVNGALVPDTRSVSVNPETGDVFGITNFSQPYADPPRPSIGLDRASDMGARSAGMTGAELKHSDLVVTFDAAGHQLLVWRLEFYNGTAAAAVQVDALTGAAVVLGRG